MGYLQLALLEHNDPVSGTAWLSSQNFLAILKREFSTLQCISAEVAAGKLPSSVLGGNYHYLVFAHAAWCMKDFDLGESFVAFAEHKDASSLSTPFWRMYAGGLGALMRRESFRPAEMKLRGQEKYWMSYLRLIEAKCNSRPIENAIAEIVQLFRLRNCDKKIKDDAYQIEGSGEHPVQWDYRLHGLLGFLEHLQ